MDSFQIFEIVFYALYAIGIGYLSYLFFKYVRIELGKLCRKKFYRDSGEKLAMKMLRDLNCSFEKDGNNVHFTYQGKDFVLRALSKHVVQFYCNEGRMDLADPNIPVLKEILNDINWQYNLVSSFYIEEADEKCLYVINSISTSFTSNITDIESYLQAILSNLFDAGNEIRSKLHLKLEEKKQESKPFKVKGFIKEDHE